jgi:hypothetical protein
MIRKLLTLFALVVGLSTAAWAADDAVSLEPGGRFVVRLDDAGAVSVEPAGSASLPNLDQNVLVQLSQAYLDPEKLAQSSGDNAAVFRSEGVTPDPIAGGQVRVSLFKLTRRDGAVETLLVLENGYNQALRYRARMRSDGRSRPTDVCTVLPRLRGYEHWPHAIERIELSEFELVPYRQGMPPVCE